eukprot:gene20104-24066_t
MAVTWTKLATDTSCFCRLRASKNSMSDSPGAYGSNTVLTNMDDSTLEDYGHHWQSCSSDASTSTTTSYTHLPDGYYLFTASCDINGGGYAAADFMFKLDNVAPVSHITPAANYDPSPATEPTYSFALSATDYYGTTSTISGTSAEPNPPYMKVKKVSTSTENGAIQFKVKVDNSGWDTKTSPFNPGSLGAGPHCISVKAYDIAKNTESYESIYCWTVETFEKTAGCTFSYSLNNAEYKSTGSHPYADVEDLPDGTNTFKLKAHDMYGNHHVDNANTFTWTVDTIKPTASFTTGGTWAETELVTSTKGTFTYKSSESGSFFKYQVDGGVFVTANTALTQTFPAETFYVGSCSGTSHSFGVKSVDPLGNVGDTVTSTFTVEPINTGLVLSNAASGSVVASSTAVFTISALVDNDAPSTFSYEYKINDGAYKKGVHFPKFGVKGLADGAYTITARAITAGGCTDPSPITVSFTVDTTAPTTTLQCPASPSNSDSLTVYGSVADATMKSSGTQYKLGSAPYSTPGSPMVPCTGCPDDTFAIMLESLVEGSYTLYAKSTDTAGMTGAEDSCSWVVDFGPPETVVVSGPPSPMHATETSFFTFACQEEGCVYMYQVDSQGYMQAPGANATFTGISQGVHTLQVYAIDAAGNADPTPAAYTWTVYGDEMYGGYCDTCSFAAKGSITPLTFVPKETTYVHGFDSSPIDDAPPPAPDSEDME